MKRIPLSGLRFGRLTVLADLPSRIQGIARQRKSFVSVRCDCGNEFEILSGSVRSGNTISCGCARNADIRKKDSRSYETWCGMWQRCRNTNDTAYHRYGGRGIKVCERWRSFDAFLEDMGERPLGNSLDRIDNNGDYEPRNCRWATPAEQARNRRSNILIDDNGEKKCLLDWCNERGVSYTAARLRRSKGRLSLPDGSTQVTRS